MSTAAEALQPLVTELPRRSAALRPVEQPVRRRRPRVAYALTALLGALAIAAAQMGLSIASTETTYRMSELTQQQRELTWQKQVLYDDIAGLSSPQYLAANAASLGMVINQSPTYLRLSDGAIIGSKKPAGYYSSVSALSKGAVGNALVTDTPLVTTPDATMQGTLETKAATDAATALPPPITDGLPTPTTR
jgi:hypothetical protein